MKIVIALASSPRQLSGVQRHAINLARCLLTRHEIAEVHLVAAPWQMGFVRDAASRDASSSSDPRLHLHSAPCGDNTMSRNLWFYSQMPRLARRLEADIVHLAYPVPIRRGAYRAPVVVSLHDLYPFDIPQNFGFPKSLLHRAVLRQCLRNADRIACVSQTTLSRLERLDARLAGKAAVAYNSLEPLPRIEVQAPLKEWEGLPFLLCVAQHRANKNVLLALRVFDRLHRARKIPAAIGLFIVGIPGPETSAIKKFISASGLAQKVVLLSGNLRRPAAVVLSQLQPVAGAICIRGLRAPHR